MPHEKTDEFRLYWPRGKPASPQAERYVGDVVTVRGWIPVFVENGLGPGGRGRTAHIKWFGRVVEFLHQIPEDELLRIKEVKPS